MNLVSQNLSGKKAALGERGVSSSSSNKIPLIGYLHYCSLVIASGVPNLKTVSPIYKVKIILEETSVTQVITMAQVHSVLQQML